MFNLKSKDLTKGVADWKACQAMSFYLTPIFTPSAGVWGVCLVRQGNDYFRHSVTKPCSPRSNAGFRVSRLVMVAISPVVLTSTQKIQAMFHGLVNRENETQTAICKHIRIGVTDRQQSTS